MELPAGNWPIRSILTPFFRPQWSHRKLGSLGYEPVDTTKYIEELRAKNARTEALREEVAANRRKLIQEQQAKYAKFRSPAAVPPAAATPSAPPPPPPPPPQKTEVEPVP